VYLSSSELVERLRQAKRELGHPVALERGVLAIAEPLDAVAIERGDRQAQLEPSAFHFDQVLDDVDHRMVFGLYERGQPRHELAIREGAER
jgi:hypothetical protein